MKVLIATGEPSEPFRPVEVSEAIESLAHHQVKFQKRLEALEAPRNGTKLDALENGEEFRDAIGTLATEVVRLQERVALLTVLVDLHQASLEQHGLVKRKPEDPLAIN